MSDRLSDWIVNHHPTVMDSYMRSCWEELWLRIVGDQAHGTPGDLQVLALIAWLNAYADDGDWDVFMEWQPGATRFTLDDEGALLIETPDFIGRCNPYDMLDQLVIALDDFINHRPAAYDRLLEAYYQH